MEKLLYNTSKNTQIPIYIQIHDIIIFKHDEYNLVSYT